MKTVVVGEVASIPARTRRRRCRAGAECARRGGRSAKEAPLALSVGVGLGVVTRADGRGGRPGRPEGQATSGRSTRSQYCGAPCLISRSNVSTAIRCLTATPWNVSWHAPHEGVERGVGSDRPSVARGEMQPPIIG